MKRYFYILTVLTGLFLLTVPAGCKQDDATLNTQQTSTVRYLESSHQPRLISEEAARESLDENPPYYTVYDNETYRYIADMYNEERASRTEVESGDLVSIYFNAYIFNYSALTNVMPYWSNHAEIIAAMEAVGGHLDPEYWSTDPLVLRAGGSDVLKGLSRALVGCREGDEVEVYMTYKAAYGSGIVGLVPKESPVAWIFTITGVKKQ